MKELTPKQALFVREYLVDLNASAAYLRAGYNTGNANVLGPRLLANAGIQGAVQEAYQKRAVKVDLTAEQVLREIKTAAFLDPLELFASDGTMLPLRDIPEHARRAISGIEVEEIFDGQGKDRVWVGRLRKIKLVSKEGTLTLAGRHLGMFTDKTELTGKDGADLFSPDQILRMADEIKKAAKK